MTLLLRDHQSALLARDIEIRRAVADATVIAACYRDSYRTAAELGYPSRMTEIDAETVADRLEADAVTLVARPTDDGGESVVGTVRMLEERPEPSLERLAVVEAWQGRGLADRLVDRRRDPRRRSRV